MMTTRLVLFALCAFALLAPRDSWAESQHYCVVCKGPDQVYRCQVNTPFNNPSDKGLQLYCIIKISKDGGHKSCAVRDDTSAVCASPTKTYTLQTPAIPPQIRSNLEKNRTFPNDAKGDPGTLPKQKGGEPKTLIEMTGRAVKASRKGLKNTGQAVSNAASSTTQKVGNVARGAGKGVTSAAKKVGSATKKTGSVVSNAAKKVGAATKKTGSAVGSAAKTAFDCLKSWFKECGSKAEDAPPAPQ